MIKKVRQSRIKGRPFSVGTRVYVSFGKSRRLARIIEDRGLIGRGGRRLLRVVFTDSDDELEQAFEIPASDVTHAPAPARTTKAKVA